MKHESMCTSDEKYYSLLEVPETATAKEIKTAYHRLIRKDHPDLFDNASAYRKRRAETRCKELNEAYSVLSNSERRRLYDEKFAVDRRQQNTSNRQAATPQTPPSAADSTRQRSHTSSRSQYGNDFEEAWERYCAAAGTSSAQSTHSVRRQQQTTEAGSGFLSGTGRLVFMVLAVALVRGCWTNQPLTTQHSFADSIEECCRHTDTRCPDRLGEEMLAC